MKKILRVLWLAGKFVIGIVCFLLMLELITRLVLFVLLNNYLHTSIPPEYREQMHKVQFFQVKTAVKQYDSVCFYLLHGGNLRGPDGHGLDGQMEIGPKTDDEIRVLCLGDSTTYGACVDYEHAYPRVLERLLHKEYANVRVLNAGIPGASPRQVKRIFQKHLIHYEPDVVLWRKGPGLTDTYELPVISDKLFAMFV
jgi:hypothetical protein